MKFSPGGPHIGRTLMLAELKRVPGDVAPGSGVGGYRDAILVRNLLAKATESTRRESFTQRIHVFPDDLETFLDFKVPDRDHRKPSRLLLGLKNGEIDPTQVEALCRLVEELAGVPLPPP